MKGWLSDDLESENRPGVGAWVLSVVLPVVVVLIIVMMVMPLGDGGRRMLSLVKQIAKSRSELLPMLFGSQLGVSALVIAITQFQPERWRRTPQELGDCWLSEARLVASQENRYIAASFGLLSISSAIVFGVAACVSQKLDAGGVLLLMVAWGVHATSSVVLIMVPMTGVAVITDYWKSLTRLVYVAEIWPGELKLAKNEIGKKSVSLVACIKRWRVVVVLTSLYVALIVVIFIGRLCFSFPRGVLLQIGVVDMVIASVLLSVGAGYGRWCTVNLLTILFWPSWFLMLSQGLILEFEFIAITTRPSLVRNVSIVTAGAITLILVVLLAIIASGARFLWGRFDFLRAILVSIWISDIRLQRRCGLKCSRDERRAVERFIVEMAKNKNKEHLVETIKNNILLNFLYG